MVTIATPHAGTRMAHFSPAPNAAQMQRGSAWLDALERRENSSEAGPSTEGLSWICYYSNCDNIVFPASSATLEWADNRQLPATPHVRMAFHPQVMAEVFEMLEGGNPNSSAAVAA